jgi:hypothetical protein
MTHYCVFEGRFVLLNFLFKSKLLKYFICYLHFHLVSFLSTLLKKKFKMPNPCYFRVFVGHVQIKKKFFLVQ